MFKQPLRVLIVDDHPDTLKYLGLYLEQLGHQVISAGSAREAVSAAATSPCDVLMSDIALGDGTGWELLKALHLPPSVCAVAMSGLGTADDVAKSKAAGYRWHLVKPINPDRVDQILEEARRERDGE
jgi:DNA-binding NtrC family response regulator